MSDQSHKFPAINQATRLRVVLAVAIIGLGLVYEITHRFLWQGSPNIIWVTIERLLLVANGVLAYYFIDRALSWRREKIALDQKLAEAEAAYKEAEKRQQLLLKMSSQFAQVDDEADLIALILRLSNEVIGAKGASFVPLDDRSQPLPAMTEGEIPFPVADAWLEYLASPGVRQRCSSCTRMEKINYECPLITGTFVDEMGVFCVPIRKAGREYGILNLYMGTGEILSENANALLRVIIDETTLLMESLRLHQREIYALQQIQSVRENTDLFSLMNKLMENLIATLEADMVLMRVNDEIASTSLSEVIIGDFPESARHLVNAIIDSVVLSGEMVSLGDIAGENERKSALRAIVAVPLKTSEEETFGVLAVARKKTKPFNQRQHAMLTTIAGQVALVIANVHRLADLEYKTIMNERIRLSREIHDGVAQSLGFLKLKMAQIIGYLERSEIERIHETIPICYETITESYQEVRQVIDGLRIDMEGSGLLEWMRRAVVEFEENMDFRVTLDEPVADIELAPEIHAQLIRILQEALNNARRHSDSDQAWVACRTYKNDLILDIRDSGKGFDISSIPNPSRHGLQGMRERAELIGADFQVISKPKEGTTVRVRLPLGLEEKAI